MWMVVLSAWAQNASTSAEVVFVDELPLLTLANVDSGYLPSASSPLAIRLHVEPTGGLETELGATSDLTWGPELTALFDAVPGSGRFAFDLLLDVSVDLKVDIAIYEDEFELVSEVYALEEEQRFDTLALPGTTDELVEILIDDIGTWEPISIDIDLITGVDLELGVDLRPEWVGQLRGQHIETNQGAWSGQQDGAGVGVAFPAPDEPTANLPFSAVYRSDLVTMFQMVLIPAVTLDTVIGDFEIASFDYPVVLLDDEQQRSFDAVTFSHGLPAVGDVSVASFDPLSVGEIANLEVVLPSIGELLLEGTARVEGGGFSVYPNYFAASPGNDAGLVVTFAPSGEGEQRGFLVVETNDPSTPELRFPLMGLGEVDEPDAPPTVIVPDDEVSTRETVRIRSCGCKTTRFGSWGWGLAVLLLVRRRR